MRKKSSDSSRYNEMMIQAVDGSQCIVASFDDAGVCEFINHGCEKILGKTPQELIGCSITELFGSQPSEKCVCRKSLTAVLATGEPHECVVTIDRHGAQRVWLVTLSLAPVVADSAKRVYCVAVDMTTCSTALAQAKESASERDRFIAVASHELRNPISAIRSGLKIVSLSPDSGSFTRVLEMMERQLTHLARLVNDLLDVSRMKEGKLILNREKVLLSEVLSLALELSRETVKRGQHQLRVVVSDESLQAHLDGRRLAQAVANLIDNGAKYTPDGGLLELRLAHERGALVIVVGDNGVGIPQSELEPIFNAYKQLKQAHPNSRGGLGLGLYLVKMIVDGHGGAISVRSDGEGKGTTFEIRIPLTGEDFPENT